MTCSQRSCVPKARTPRTWVTVLASQPSVSMETETTQRMDPPSRPCLPTVFITSRSSSWSVMFSACAAVAGALDDLAAEALDLVGRPCSRKLSSSASPDSSCSLSIRSVLRAGERVAVLVEVAEQRQTAVLERASSRRRSRGGSRRCSRRRASRWRCCCRRR